MSSSSGRYDNDNSSSSISIPNISNLQLYDLEPYHQAKLVVTVITVILTARKKELEILIDWCVCGGKCRPMETLPKVYVVVIQMKFQMNLNFLFKSSLFLQRTTSEKL